MTAKGHASFALCRQETVINGPTAAFSCGSGTFMTFHVQSPSGLMPGSTLLFLRNFAWPSTGDLTVAENLLFFAYVRGAQEGPQCQVF